MSTTTTLLIVFLCVFGAALIGMLLRQTLPEHHLSSDTKDTVKVAMGFVATMAALILGLLVASAKDSYDKQASGVTDMAAKIIYLDRLLANYGPETKDVRALYRHVVEGITERMWPDDNSGDSQLDPRATRAEELFAAIESLKATNDLQSTLKSQAASTSLELGQLRWLEYEQARTSASKPMLCILVFWTSVLFASFGIFAPKNGTVIAALFLAALSVAGAIFLIEELRSPFTGILQIPKAEFDDAAKHLGT
jgi:ABC-type amino acid transport system permease subunit